MKRDQVLTLSDRLYKNLFFWKHTVLFLLFQKHLSVQSFLILQHQPVKKKRVKTHAATLQNTNSSLHLKCCGCCVLKCARTATIYY